MRRVLCLAVLCIVLPVLPVAAQTSPKPPALQPLPEPPPPPAGFELLDPSMEPQVTITRRGADTVEEYRVGGRLYMMKVTPIGGPPFYLIDERGDGKFNRQESYDTGTRPPMWVIHQF